MSFSVRGSSLGGPAVRPHGVDDGALTPAASPRRRSRWGLPRLPRVSWVAFVVVVTVVWGWNIAARLPRGAPHPVIHDEFAYLLAADTFAQGRWTNPSPPYPVFWETFHEIMTPTRASKYPPGQGLVLALGTVVAGNPFFGVWLGGWFFCMATAWMTRAIAPRRWAMAAAFLAALHPQSVEWSLRYWGGLLAATGAALVVGAALRLHRQARSRDAFVFAGGASILALTRPFEGALFCLVVVVAVAVGFLRRRGLRALLWHCAIPVALGLLPVTALGLAYNHAVTGHALVLPYAVYQKRHLQTPPFLWQSIDDDVIHRHPAMEQFEQIWIERFKSQHTLSGFVAVKGRLLKRQATGFYAYGAVFLPAIVASSWLRLRRARRPQTATSTTKQPSFRAPHNPSLGVSLGLIVAAVLVLLPETFGHNHYVAWGLPAAILVAVAGSRWLAVVVGRRRVAWVAFGAVVAAAYLVSFSTRTHRVRTELKARFAVEQQLRDTPGRHLVFVHYLEGHRTYDEWVYNPANLDDAPVLFVRDQGADNPFLADQMPDRTVWFAQVGPRRQTLEPYIPGRPDDRLPKLDPMNERSTLPDNR
jgi:hypothetical protein